MTTPKLHHSVYSLTDSSDIGPDDEELDARPSLTPLERLSGDMCKNKNTIKELMIGRRVGFYKVRGEIGCGTFSRVKLAFHALTKGRCATLFNRISSIMKDDAFKCHSTHTVERRHIFLCFLLPDKVAMKILDKTRMDTQVQRLLSREISSMEVLRNPNVLHLYEVVETPSRLHLVLEYAGGGDLHNRICNEGKLSDNTSKITFAQILSAIKYMVSFTVLTLDIFIIDQIDRNDLFKVHHFIHKCGFGSSLLTTQTRSVTVSVMRFRAFLGLLFRRRDNSKID